IPVDFRPSRHLGILPPDVQLTVYRIVQEGLRNVARHSGAGEVALCIDRQEGSVKLVIEDDGRGFDRSDPAWKPGLGLASMTERARLIGGTMTIQAAPGRGTRVCLEVPEVPK
ncbi:MAG TPA: ATP-binding protein, partial [Bryobacteraceae bacterium]|nr:ATP-binding protein [Bryobacteraceae bacterium]